MGNGGGPLSLWVVILSLGTVSGGTTSLKKKNNIENIKRKILHLSQKENFKKKGIKRKPTQWPLQVKSC